MRVLWVYECMSRQVQAMASVVAQHPSVDLEIMTRSTDLPSELAHLTTIPLECRSKVDFRARRAIRAQIVKGEYDVVHCYTSRNFANTLAACRGIKPLPKVIGYRGTINRLSRLDPANWITFWHPRAAGITCVCDATQSALRASGIAAAKLGTVWEGCNPTTLGTPDGCTRSDFDIPDDAFVVGTVANMRRVKGMHLLLEAARRDLADIPNLYFLLIGEVFDKDLERLAQDPLLHSRVRLPGRIPQGGRYVSLFDVYAAPSLMEGLSMSIMETMVKGVCPIVSDAGGNVELIRHEQDGLVVPAGDATALGNAVRRLYVDPQLRAQLASSAHERVGEVFSISQWGQRLVETYQRMSNVATATAA